MADSLLFGQWAGRPIRLSSGRGPKAPRHPEDRRPVGWIGATHILCCRRDAGPGPGQWRTGPSGPGTTCRRTTVMSASSHRTRARGRGDDSDAHICSC